MEAPRLQRGSWVCTHLARVGLDEEEGTPRDLFAEEAQAFAHCNGTDGEGEDGPTIPLECSLSEQRVAQVPSRRDAKPHADRTVGEAGQSGLSAS